MKKSHIKLGYSKARSDKSFGLLKWQKDRRWKATLMELSSNSCLFIISVLLLHL